MGYSADIPLTAGTVQANGVELAYESWGESDKPVMLLVMGLSCQMWMWPDPFVALLVKQGFRVVRFDNRDVGGSSSVKRQMPINLPLSYFKYRLGSLPKAHYNLHDMAEDTLALMNALKLTDVHLVGVSMGGMIGQLLAAKHPDKLESLTLLMTSTNHPNLPTPDPRLIKFVFARKLAGRNKQRVVDHQQAMWETIGSPAYPTDPNMLRQLLEQCFDRDFRPAGMVRQTHAILATGSLIKWTREVTLPTQIIHGMADPLISVKASLQLKQLISGAKLVTIPGMGHDIPQGLYQTISDIITNHIKSHESD
ncbi:alpha/beta fold hydrolase [Spartinivicinus poritis]|uniref:Alpha/beta hydrolase n=1 Tax=Spartinivicinus poritis TaxID=2994640 RepID=A0ABT5UJG1_9GAMM|nr:alpha/beta hydrolase [Spartinivicinus sp. A2-2]MDE1465179.1 alpha/beta hydrolase [Spartinivicinus sp. A2-2]